MFKKALGIFLMILFIVGIVGRLIWLKSEAELEPLPMEVHSRPSLLGQGDVAIIWNPTKKTLYQVRIVCRNSESNREKEYFVETWEPEKLMELGWLEGWQFTSGDTLTISALGYKPMTWKVK